MKDKVSVIIPVYNVAEYLPKCINSILAQTYMNLEIIMINDGSTDQCAHICDAYSEKECRIKVIHQENKGVSAARNVGLEHATGEYIAFVDGDDWIEADMYERMIGVHKSYRVSVVACAWYIDNVVTQVTTYRGIHEEKLSSQAELLELIYRPSILNGVLWNKLFRAEVIYDRNHKVKHYFDESIKVWEDVLWLSKVIISSRTSAYLLPDHLYHYIHRSDSAVAVGFHPGKLSMIDSAWKVRKELVSHNIDQSILTVFDNYVHIHFRGAIYEIYHYAPQFHQYIGKFRINALRIGKYKLLYRNAKFHNLLLYINPRLDALFISALVKVFKKES
jgi:glycosyltransferase involved in cell wall biosynthesis